MAHLSFTKYHSIFVVVGSSLCLNCTTTGERKIEGVIQDLPCKVRIEYNESIEMGQDFLMKVTIINTNSFDLELKNSPGPIGVMQFFDRAGKKVPSGLAIMPGGKRGREESYTIKSSGEKALTFNFKWSNSSRHFTLIATDPAGYPYGYRMNPGQYSVAYRVSCLFNESGMRSGHWRKARSNFQGGEFVVEGRSDARRNITVAVR